MKELSLGSSCSILPTARGLCLCCIQSPIFKIGGVRVVFHQCCGIEYIIDEYRGNEALTLKVRLKEMSERA